MNKDKQSMLTQAFPRLFRSGDASPLSVPEMGMTHRELAALNGITRMAQHCLKLLVTGQK